MDFIEMWEEADFVDAAIGGVDSIPEEEYLDYVGVCLMIVGADIKEHQETTKSASGHFTKEAKVK